MTVQGGSGGNNAVIGVDVGGTNTDLVLLTDGREEAHKLPTSEDQSESSVQGMLELCEANDIAPEEVEFVYHGTTIATNALIERTGAKTGLLTTKGYRDVLEIGRGRTNQTFSVKQFLPRQKFPLVQRRYRRPITERVYPPGEVVRPLDESEVLDAATELVEDGIEAIAVCYLHSYLDSTHERRTSDLIQEQFPTVSVSTSHETAPEFREYERFSTTVINAQIKPIMSAYLNRFVTRLADNGFVNAELLIMQSIGGLAGVEEITARPISTILSGPAAGVLAGYSAGIEEREPLTIALDMGGTSTDISVIPDRILERNFRDRKIMDEYPTNVPMLDIETIGNGGGSIAWFDDANGFNVGPKSAGADPGPACFGRGNDRPTVTDAQVLLRRINPENVLGGRVDIDPELSRAAIERHLVEKSAGEPRFETVERAALSILEVSNSNTYQALRTQTLQRGYDPREFTLVAFGGAGPMHATDIADEIGIQRVMILPTPGNASARGLLTGDISYTNRQTISQSLSTVSDAEIEETFERLVDRCDEQLKLDGLSLGDASVERSIDCMYQGQGYDLNVEFDGTAEGWRDRIRERFNEKHNAEFGHYFEANPIKLLHLRVTAVVETDEYRRTRNTLGSSDPSAAIVSEETVTFGSSLEPARLEVPRYAREKLQAGNIIEGPAVVDETTSTTVINPGWQANVTETATMILEPMGSTEVAK